MKVFLSRAALAVCLFALCSLSCHGQVTSTLACVTPNWTDAGGAQESQNCVILAGYNTLPVFQRSDLPPNMPNESQAIGQLICGGPGNLASVQQTVNSIGPSNVYNVHCHTGIPSMSIAKICTGGSTKDTWGHTTPLCPASNYTATHDCNYYTDPNHANLEASVASDYCSSMNRGVYNYYRVPYLSGSGGQCGKMVDFATCLPYNAQGNVFPKYYVMDLLYSPPGCNSTGQLCNANSVTYTNQSSNGTTSTIQHTETQAYSLSAKGGGTFGSASASFSRSPSSTDIQSQSVTMTSTQGPVISGAANGIDHDQDTFLILVNPGIQLTSFGQTLMWNMATTNLNGYLGSNAPDIQPLTVYELKHPIPVGPDPLHPLGPIPNSVWHDLQAAHFTSTDFQTILALDPFANGLRYAPNGTFLEPSNPFYDSRYADGNLSFPYSPPGGNPSCPSTGCPCLTTYSGGTLQTTEDDSSHMSSVTYTVDASATGGNSVFSVTAEGKFTWSNSSTTANKNSLTTSATAKISCPSQDMGYAEVEVWRDKMFGSYLFVPLENPPDYNRYRGTLISSCRREIPRLPVDLEINGMVYRTSTNERGEFSFYGTTLGQAKAKSPTGMLSVNGLRQSVNLGSKATVDICGHEVLSQPGVVTPGLRIPPVPEPAPVHEGPMRPQYPGQGYQPPTPFPAPVPSPSAQRCAAPFVAGAYGKCACPQGTVQAGNECVQQRGYPQQPGAGATREQPQASCPAGTALRGKECVRQDQRDPQSK